MYSLRLFSLSYRIALFFSLLSTVYFSLQVPVQKEKLLAVAGSLSLVIFFLYTGFKSVYDWINERYSIDASYLFAFITFGFTFGFAFSIYALYYFSMKMYKDYTDASKDQKKLVINTLGIIGSLFVFLIILPLSWTMIFLLFMFVAYIRLTVRNLLRVVRGYKRFR